MSKLASLVWVDSPAALPHTLAPGRFAVLDVAFASQDKFAGTERFIRTQGHRLAAWVDHHKHERWVDYQGDPRFVLVPNVNAHACPELVTPEVVARAGEVAHLLAHSDFDGMMSAVMWLRAGVPPYPEALEDARAADSPGRGHAFTERGRRLHDALEQHRDQAHTDARHALLSEVVQSLVGGVESPDLGARLDALAHKAAKVTAQAQALAQRGRAEAPGVMVVRHGSNLSSRLKKAVLMLAELRAEIGVVVEGQGPFHVTAATFREDLDLGLVGSALPTGRSDYRFVNRIDDPDAIIRALSVLARPYG
ncbi:MAG: hypothetical protein AB2A00_42080 [Myxococcota bacterium]